MHPQFGVKKIYGLAFLLLLTLPEVAFGLSCQDVRKLIGYYLQAHISIHDFDDEMGKRTLTNFIKAWDPGKVFFLQEDVDNLMKNNLALPSMIASSNCSTIDSVFNLYSKRFDEKQEIINQIIDSKHDFKIDEYLEIDRKSMTYPKTAEESKDRWRKRIKFQHMQLLTSVDGEDKVREKLHKRYSLMAKRQKELNMDEVYGIFLDSFSNALDPHSDYYSPSKLEEFRISNRLSLEGIGAMLSSEDGITSIQSLVPGGAAQKSGLIKIGDKITAVAQKDGTPADVIDMDVKDVANLIRGTLGTEVRLTVRREGKTFVAPIIREKIQLKDQAAKSKFYTTEVDIGGVKKSYKIGVIELPSFYMDFESKQANKDDFKSSSKDMKKELDKINAEKADALIVDIRTNGGGHLEEAIDIGGLFTGEGPIVQTKSNETRSHTSAYGGKAAYTGPLVLMIDRQSASASEILAGAIKDYDRGLIIGDVHTFGKGTVQILNELDPKLGAIKVTVSKFYRPSGASTQLKGVDSDIVLPSIMDSYEIGEKFYDYAQPWDAVQKVTYKEFNMVKPFAQALNAQSGERVKSDKGFKEIKDAVAKYEKDKQEHTKVSLKEKSAEEKAKEAKEQKELEEKSNKLEKDEFGNFIHKLGDDIFLQEGIKIATDYVRLINKEKLVDAKILELDVPKKEVIAAKKTPEVKPEAKEAAPKAPAVQVKDAATQVQPAATVK